jgi:V/A-type H+/Na+-transporting ATPase subunit D
MPPTASIPPGRSGRMWLRRRIDTAERGRDQLDRKLRILVPELQRLRLQAAQRRRVWDAACVEADTWLLRATLLGGQDTLRAMTPTAGVDVEIRWSTATGLSYPTVALINPPAAPPGAEGNAAIEPAAANFRAALQAGVRTAAADEAVRRMEGEIALTRRRLRALEKRWLPWLRATLDHLELSLEQGEQEDAVRLRRAVDPPPDRRSPP